MAYTTYNYLTKKALKLSVESYMNNHDGVRSIYPAVKCYQPGLGPDLSNYTGKICLEGPHYPQAHTWYAEAELINGIVVKVK